MTISEIAQKAGVSKSAVSRFLNDGYISEDKKEKIKAVIEQTGYAPSRQAQQLRTGKTRIIGVVLPKINSDSVSRIVAGISSVLNKNEYQILLANTENDVEEELTYLELFRRDKVDGIILIATLITSRHKAFIKKLSIPIVVLGQSTDFISCIYHDDRGAAKALTSLMLNSGRKHIGYIGVTKKDKSAGLDRMLGYQSALEEKGIALKEALLTEGAFSMESGYENAKILLSRNIELDGIFCATDFIAVGAMKYLKEIGKKIPDEICLTGIGHTVLSEVITPSLTTAHYHYKTSGIEAAEMVLEQISAKDSVKRELKLGYQIIVGNSTV